MSANLVRPDSPPGGLPEPSARIVSLLLRGARRRRAQEAVRAGTLTRVMADDVLAAQKLPRLATQSLWLLIGSAALYALCVGASRRFWQSGSLFGDAPLWQRIALLIVTNIIGYILVIPAHEATHALVILALGGRPRFGLRLPLAAYCTAPNQLFTRNGYLVVALAPLIALSLAGLAVAALAPDSAATLLLAFAGNVSGAIGDLEAMRGVRKLQRDTLIADTETGYIAYQPNT
jgi:hypothetical protein